ncbi:hypothetical protein ACOSP7_025933 [Xanthoceras sorbifolium]|uniref:WAT1-related protein n=1 Tax=Xanthoceras sorbifolium TaxID=99658 RepID=A0ABQ8H5Z4_9ROSI|nr:hypothetical protein JRO89_XS13G0015900 [Xanthoceras sorbifolium]
MASSITSSSYFVAIAMVLVQLSYGGSNILIKISFDKGLNQIVLVVYRHIIAMLLLGPFAYVLERKQRSSLSFSVLVKIFVLALIGTTVQLNVFYVGLHYTSATVASALNNALPSLTFLMAFLLGMEKVKMSSNRSRAKVLGTLLCIVGSLVFTFWKGHYLFKSLTKRPLINISSHIEENWVKGSGLMLIGYMGWSVALILQAMILKVYPAPLSINTLICFFVLLQNSVLAVLFGRDPNLWKLEWNVQLLTNVYCGVVNSAIVYYVQTWCISKKGPVFAAMFSPLQVVIVGIFSAVAFAERFHVGSMVGAVLVIVGLYCVVWGKKMDSLIDEDTEDDKEKLGNEKTVEISCQK